MREIRTSGLMSGEGKRNALKRNRALPRTLQVAPGITAMDASGHTPGQCVFVIAQGNGKLLFQADVTNLPDLFLRNPDWHVMFDHEPEKAVATRRRIHDMAAAEKLLVHGFHYPFPALGYSEKSGNGYRMVPVAWNPTL